MNSALQTWNDKLAEIWTLLTQDPATFKGGGIWQVIGTMVMTLLIGNIMTLILLAIFFAVRHSRKKKSEMEKMNIQDL